jgi:wyosine [tRNA(Phe)-imidazoG37] synthetase (radical SAM superfamily)
MDESRLAKSGDIITDHRRQWRDCRYVYPVVSRRARGVSIGVNLNLDKRCSFNCLYCQINRRIRREPMEVIIPILRKELDLALDQACTGLLWQEERFCQTPAELRRINDIAFSGDGEPTCLENFDQAVQAAADALGQYPHTEPIKLIVITNASGLQSPQFRRALPILDASNGEIWAKLDAGSEEFFRKVNRPGRGITLREIMENILSVAQARPVVIQTLWFRIDGLGPVEGEIAAYCDRLKWLENQGGQIKLVQLHTIARPPASAKASALPNDQLDAIAKLVRESVVSVPVEVYYGRAVAPQR